MLIRKTIIAAILISLIVISAFGQDNSGAPAAAQLNPVDTVKEFYRLLREKKYLEGFRLSVYRAAVEPLTAEELKELEPDFENTFSKIPENLKVHGSQTNGNNSTVFIKLTDNPKDYTLEEVTLIKVDGQWIIGDQETLGYVKELGRNFFFEVRVRVNEESVNLMVERCVGAQKLYASANKGLYGSLNDLVKSSFWPDELKNGESYGYKMTVELSGDRREFWLHAEPIIYNKTGRVSFYADLTSGVRKFENNGKVYRFQPNAAR